MKVPVTPKNKSINSRKQKGGIAELRKVCQFPRALNVFSGSDFTLMGSRGWSCRSPHGVGMPEIAVFLVPII